MHGDVHRLTSVNFMMTDAEYDAKLGIATIKNRWGHNNRNQCTTLGLNSDLSFTSQNLYMPWIGIKAVWYNPNTWFWYDHEYISAYTKYKYDFMRKSGIKQFGSGQ